MQLPLSPSSIDAAPARSANITWARSRFSAFFHGTSVHTSRPFTSSPSAGPKSARSSDQLPARSPLHLPEIGGGSATHSRSRTSTRSMIDPTSSPAISTRLFTADTYMRLIMAPTVPEQSHPASPASFAGVDPEEQHLVQQINDRRQRPRRKRRRAIVVSRRAVPKMKRNAVRGRVRGCILWGILLTIVLTIYLALAISNTVSHQAFHVLMILLILVLTILFCHSLIRLCMLLLNPRTDIEQGVRVIDRAESEEYAQPEQPIRVVLARDEEIGISGTDDSVGEDDGPTPPPPAYGIWRCSVKADPNLLHWQHVIHPAFRQEAVDREGTHERPATANRPPSYISNEPIIHAPDQFTAGAPGHDDDATSPLHPSERYRHYLR